MLWACTVVAGNILEGDVPAVLAGATQVVRTCTSAAIYNMAYLPAWPGCRMKSKDIEVDLWRFEVPPREGS